MHVRIKYGNRALQRAASRSALIKPVDIYICIYIYATTRAYTVLPRDNYLAFRLIVYCQTLRRDCNATLTKNNSYDNNSDNDNHNEKGDEYSWIIAFDRNISSRRSVLSFRPLSSLFSEKYLGTLKPLPRHSQPLILYMYENSGIYFLSFISPPFAVSVNWLSRYN